MSLTEDLTFMLKDDGVVLNTDDAGLPFVDVHKVTGLDSAPFRTAERDHEGTDGGFIDAEFEKGRSILLDGMVYADSSNIETYLDTLKANFAPSRVVFPFYYKAPGVVERVVFVKPLGVRYNWEQALRLGMTPIQFHMYAEDPRIYDSTLIIEAIDFGAVVYTGIGFPLAFPFGFGGLSTTSDGKTIYNYGNRPAPVVFEIQGPATNPRILNDTVSAEMIFSITLEATDTLTVDTLNRTVKLNDTANRRNKLVQPDWFMLEPGGNFIRYRAEAGTGSSMSASYRHAWR